VAVVLKQQHAAGEFLLRDRIAHGDVDLDELVVAEARAEEEKEEERKERATHAQHRTHSMRMGKRPVNAISP
jgi:hypothetical protein